MSEADYRALISDLADLLAYYARDGKDERVCVALCRAFDAGAWRPMSGEAFDRIARYVDSRRMARRLRGG